MAQTKSPPTIFADIGNRAAATLLDLLLLIIVAPLTTSAKFPGQYIYPLLVFLYFTGMPLSPLQGTLGKWVCRIKLCDRLGRRLTWRASAVRTGVTLCWFVLPFLLNRVSLFIGVAGTAVLGGWWLLFALPWASAGFLPRRESLFDLLAGSMVVRYAADTESIVRAEPVQMPGILNVGGNVLLCLVTGALFSITALTQHDMNLRGRVAYAIEQTTPLRDKIEGFHDFERRWPTAGELDIPEWTPYPDGGGYRLEADGSILITFSVLPELKGHSIAVRPTRTADGKNIHWQCSTDGGFKPVYLPANCR